MLRRVERDPIPAEVARSLADRIRGARASRPNVCVDEEAFTAWVLERVARGDGSRVASRHTVDDLPLDDLLLAYACAHGDPSAVAAFDASMIGDLDAALAHLRLDPAVLEDVTQAVRVKLLVGDASSPPKIGTYSGRGTLKGWVRAVAVRTALNVLRARKADAPREDDDALLAQRSSADDAELAFVKSRYAEHFRDAFRDAVAALAPRDRLLLRQYYVDRVATPQLAAIYGLHPVSVVRWLGRVRATVAETTRALLVERLALRPSEVRSLVRLVRSQIDVSIVTVLES